MIVNYLHYKLYSFNIKFTEIKKINDKNFNRFIFYFYFWEKSMIEIKTLYTISFMNKNMINKMTNILYIIYMYKIIYK